MRLPVIATFVERATQRKIRGQIRRTTLFDVQLQSQWPYAANALDRNWNWLEVWLLCRANPQRFECYSAFASDELHGLMALDLRGRKTGTERGLVVDYLATSPEDRIEGAGLKYIGVNFMAVAVARSIEAGMQGRIWLESLADPKTLQFYQNIGMTRSPRKSSDGYDVFVFEIDCAMEFLVRAQTEKWIAINPE